jgi:ABC-type Fe3+-siderophore transport system permease subunit
MSERPSARFYVIGLSSLALLCVALVLTANESAPTLAAVLGVIGALGMFVCARIVKRQGS